jgi:hypothetical protein
MGTVGHPAVPQDEHRVVARANKVRAKQVPLPFYKRPKKAIS